MSTRAPKQLRRSGQRNGTDALPQGLERGMLPDLLGYQLRLAQLAVFRDFARSLADFSLSPGRVGILVLIEANPGISQSRLAEAVGLDRSTMVPVIDGFEQLGVVQRRAGKDRRTNGLWLTREGARGLMRMKERVVRHEANVTRGLSSSERRTLSKLLAKLLASHA
jgi:DNA-binding MarR family transcriptional regulator